MMDLSNMTQLEIEEVFSRANLKEAMETDYSRELNKLDVKLFDELETITNRDVDEIVLKVIGMVSNKANGTYIEAINCIRIHTNDVFKFITNLVDNDFEEAELLLLAMDEHLYDIIQMVEFKDGVHVTTPYCESNIVLNEDETLIPYFTQFRLPMIEEPEHWTKDSQGGYLVDKDKITFNRGASKQPQNVCDVLNKLQGQSYKMAEHVSYDDEFRHVSNKAVEKKGDCLETMKDVENSMLSTKHAYEAMVDKEFYFVWRYDFRGRMYSIGYNLNLQSDKYKKGSLIPQIKGQ